MTYHYHALIKFDDEASVGTPYFAVLTKYDAFGRGHKDGTSSMFFYSDKPVLKKTLAKDLCDLEILAFKETKC